MKTAIRACSVRLQRCDLDRSKDAGALRAEGATSTSPRVPASSTTPQAKDYYQMDNEEPSRKRKTYKNRYDPFTLKEEEFKNKYRFTKAYARYVVELVREDIQQNSKGGGFSTELQVCTALRTWAPGSPR
ncbi:hypothetical protein EVAR_53539_1 [Eumeta japonica]|uniref:Uncharacterized protein n=1 Tax=Eumeta variegata TaxID=151549 RepID=A0A4C1Y8X0_EUMVA|nr:hypothetical protein EVAR_53539_1 [Eumeta japonica]